METEVNFSFACNLFFSTNSADAETVSAVYRLLLVVSSDATCIACRPVARMVVVLYSELLPFFLTHCAGVLSTIAAESNAAMDGQAAAAARAVALNHLVCLFSLSSSQHSAEEVVSLSIARLQSLYSSVRRHLMLSLQHPEAPFVLHYASKQASRLPSALAGIVATAGAGAGAAGGGGTPSLFGGSAAVTNYLSLQGSFIPFRVKQDHIGAVSLLKVITALLHHQQQATAVSVLRSILAPPPSLISARPGAESLFNNLPLLFSKLHRVHGEANGSIASAVVLMNKQFQLTVEERGDFSFQLLGYCYFYLTVLQQIPR